MFKKNVCERNRAWIIKIDLLKTIIHLLFELNIKDKVQNK